MVNLKRIVGVLVAGVLLHFCAMAVLLAAGGMIMSGFDHGSSVSPMADFGLGFVQVVWWPSALLPRAPSGMASHLLGILNASAWIALFYGLTRLWKQRRVDYVSRAAGR